MSVSAFLDKISPARGGLIVGLIVFAFFAAVINSQPRGWASWLNLAMSGERAEAIITKRQPENHQTCYFEYKVESVVYEGADQGCHFEVGNRVEITYLPRDPSFSTTDSPSKNLMFLVVAPLALAMIGAFSTAFRLSRRKSLP